MLVSLTKCKYNNLIVLVLAYLITILITLFVYITGGTHTVYANFMYIPIVMVASTNGKIKGLIHALISGFLLGPFMPMIVELNKRQQPHNWIFRIIIYSIIALVVAFFADYYKKEFEKNNKNEIEISEAHFATIYALVKLSESRDGDTGAHVERVSEFCKHLSIKMQNLPEYKQLIDDKFIDNISRASPLHDIGKVAIPDNILLKPGKLTFEEFEVIKEHTVKGANTILEVQKKYPNNKFLEIGINITYYHHEKWDGTGYPKGLSKDEIPLSARIMAIVDVYDALRSKRVYKEPFTHDKSLDIIKQGRGTHFDPDIVDIFIENHKYYNNLYNEITENNYIE